MNHNILVMFRAFLTRFDEKNAEIGRDSAQSDLYQFPYKLKWNTPRLSFLKIRPNF